MSEEGEDEDKKPSPIEARIAQVKQDASFSSIFSS